MDRLKLLEVSLSFMSSLAWPAVVLAVIYVFRRQVDCLLRRLRSGEIAGAKFDFNEAASGYIQSQIDILANESDLERRGVIASKIKAVASSIGGLPPISLGLLITAAGSTNWAPGMHRHYQDYFDRIEEAGLAKVMSVKDYYTRVGMPDEWKLDNKKDGPFITLVFYPKGIEFLKEIGFTEEELQGIKKV